MFDLSKISTDLLSDRRNALFERYLEHREFMKFYYMQFLEVDTEIERRKELDKDDRKKQMAEAISKALFEPTLSKREDK